MSNQSSSPAIKFRPSLSAAQISHLIALCAASPIQDSMNASCMKQLRIYELKARHGIVSPSHITTPRPTLVQSLGFGSDEDPEIADAESIDILVDMYSTHPKSLSRTQLERVQYHRYTSDLMSPTEEQEYENSTAQSK